MAPYQRSSPKAICTVSSPSTMLYRPSELSASYLHGFHSVYMHAASVPPTEAGLHKLFALFPVRLPGCLAPCQPSSPQANCTVSSRSTMLYRSLPTKLTTNYLHGSCPSTMLSRFLPAKLSANYLRCYLSQALHFCIAPFPRSSPQAICTFSPLSTMLSCSLLAKLSASYLHSFPI